MRNLAYRRSAFFDNRIWNSHLSLQSGDDDLFVNAFARGNNCRAVIKPESFSKVCSFHFMGTIQQAEDEAHVYIRSVPWSYKKTRNG
ncbi:MAG: hypothetical protein R2727_05595 [Bacteroidales bacterium]